VSRGDSVSELAKRFGVSERELVFDNSIRNRSIIYRGQELKIRDAKKSPARPLLDYKVKRGDSLAKIAKRHAASESHLVDVNNLSNPNHIEVGQIVRIPPS
jgi:LysM repeat protein